VQRRLFWIFVVGMVVSGVALLAQSRDGTFATLTSNDMASLIVRVAFAVFLGGTVLVLFRDHFSKALEAALFWVIFGLVLAVGYTYRFELGNAYERVLAEMIPGRAASHGRMVEIARGKQGEFNIGARLNGARVPMILDTGASAVVITHEAAKAAGLPLEVLTYDVNIDTANGRTRAASVTLDRVAVGAITERAVPALIAQPGLLKANLLGRTFLNRLESWEVRGDKLILRGYP
jgi:aspartyl protease family protein